MTPKEMELWHDEWNGMRYTKDCIDISEFARLPSISDARLKHAEKCPFCKKIIAPFHSKSEEK